MVQAGSFDPPGAPADTMKTLEDIYCKQLYGCTASSYDIDRSVAPASTMYTLTAIYDQVPDFPEQAHQVYDDANCAANNEELDNTCASEDPEYTGEEASWTSSTDGTPPAALESGKVYKDGRTGLYWSDRTTAIYTNEFTIGIGCTDNQINSGECDSSMYQIKGNAIQACLDLDLDCLANGCSSSTDWRLPTQKELMQAYINGIGNNAPNADDFFWSCSEAYNNTANAWGLRLHRGYVGAVVKTNDTVYIRCVRP